MVPEKQMLYQFIKNALAEDIGDGDHTSLACIPQGKQGKAHLLVKENGIIAGVELAEYICNQVDTQLQLEILIKDGQPIKIGDIAFNLSGKVHSILIAERLLLNCMQRMSGIATITHRIADKIKNTGTKVLDTRKTTPGMRMIEKWAVSIGGGTNHRFGLYDMILIKDNHVDYAGGITEAITAAKDYLLKTGKELEIEIEVRNLVELNEALKIGGINRIMLDNFNYIDLQKAVSLIGNRYKTEASGGITEETVLDYAKCGVDFISIGALTHSVKSLDLSLKAI